MAIDHHPELPICNSLINSERVGNQSAIEADIQKYLTDNPGTDINNYIDSLTHIEDTEFRDALKRKIGLTEGTKEDIISEAASQLAKFKAEKNNDCSFES